jgi:cell division protein FtsI (penicillin-binding protein 3)
MLGLIGLALNLFRLQIGEAAVLREKALEQQMVYFRPFVPRRSIVDRTGNVLAMDRPVYTLYAHPQLFDLPKADVAASLAPVLNRDALDLARQFEQGDSGIELEYALSESVADQINQLRMNGLELVQYQQRVYPQNDLFAHIVGFVDVDRQGQAGVEHTQQSLLERPVQQVRLSRSGDGSVIPERVPLGFTQRDDLRLKLTLDNRLQRSIRTKLRQQMEQYGAKRGAVLVMDGQNGAIPALVTEPSYNPNQYYETSVKLFRNWAVSDLYEPGSTFKPINVAIALEERAVKPDDVFYDEGQLQFGEWTVQNYDYEERGGRGSQTVAEIVTHSSNVGMVHIMQQLKPDVYYHWLEKLGLGKATGIDLPSEASSQIKDFNQFTGARIEPATTAFGQGFSLTPIQLLQLHSILANGGKLVTPHVVEGLVNSEGQSTWQPSLPPPKPIFSPQTTHAVLSMMEEVVKDGTGQAAQIAGYRIAGKTGTAQKASPDGGYLSDARITSFVGIFPANAPQYVVLVIIDEPQGEDAYGSTVAAPIAKSVMESLIAIARILPTEPVDESVQIVEEESASQLEDEITLSDEESYDSEPADESMQEWEDGPIEESVIEEDGEYWEDGPADE